jgi:hypothetical protein
MIYGVGDLPRVFLGLFQAKHEENHNRSEAEMAGLDFQGLSGKWTRMNADKIQ